MREFPALHVRQPGQATASNRNVASSIHQTTGPRSWVRPPEGGPRPEFQLWERAPPEGPYRRTVPAAQRVSVDRDSTPPRSKASALPGEAPAGAAEVSGMKLDRPAREIESFEVVSRPLSERDARYVEDVAVCAKALTEPARPWDDADQAVLDWMTELARQHQEQQRARALASPPGGVAGSSSDAAAAAEEPQGLVCFTWVWPAQQEEPLPPLRLGRTMEMVRDYLKQRERELSREGQAR